MHVYAYESLNRGNLMNDPQQPDDYLIKQPTAPQYTASMHIAPPQGWPTPAADQLADTRPPYTQPADTAPRMFNSKAARVVWTLVPLVSLSLLAWMPFVIAATKGVVSRTVAIVYCAAAIAVWVLIGASPKDSDLNVTGGLLMIGLAVVAAVHAAQLDVIARRK